jgi:hypothetical protein
VAGLVEESIETLTTGIADGSYIPRVRAFNFSALAFVGGVVVGGTVAYFVTERMLRTKYQTAAETEIDEMREHFRRKMVAREKKPDLGDLGAVIETAKYGQPKTYEVPPEAETVVGVVEDDPGAPRAVRPPVAVRNVFEEKINTAKDKDDGWDYENELATRDISRPHVIHEDERGEHGFDVVQMTWYEADDVLCNDEDVIIDDRDRVVGDENLDKFGHGSGDRNIVFVRNVDLAIEVEICKSPNSYSEEVAGIKHADEDENSFYRRRRGRRFEEG